MKRQRGRAAVAPAAGGRHRRRLPCRRVGTKLLHVRKIKITFSVITRFISPVLGVSMPIDPLFNVVSRCLRVDASFGACALLGLVSINSFTFVLHVSKFFAIEPIRTTFASADCF